MIYVEDRVFLDYIQWDGKEKFQNFLNQPKWDPENLSEKEKHKKLCFRDLVYISLQKTLEEYGFKEEKLVSLHRMFYQKKQVDNQEDTDSMFTSEVAIGCIFMGIDITLCITLSGEATFYDPANFISLRNPNISSFIFISLSSLVNESLARIKKEPKQLKITMQSLFASLS